MDSTHIRDIIQRYKDLQEKEAAIKQEKEEVKAILFHLIDQEHGQGAKGGVQGGNLQAVREIRTSTQINQEALIDLLLKKAGVGAEELETVIKGARYELEGLGVHGITFVPQLDHEQVKAMVDDGTLTEEEFMSCVTVKETAALRVREVKEDA